MGLHDAYKIGHPHIILDSVATKLRFVTGTYDLQSNHPTVKPVQLYCPFVMYHREPENRKKFLHYCSVLQIVRQLCLLGLQDASSSYDSDTIYLMETKLLQLLLNCRLLTMDEVITVLVNVLQ